MIADISLPRIDPIKTISTITALLVAVVALLGFVLSYSSLQHMAAANGIEGRLSYLWPLLLDFAMIVFSLAILRANLRAESTKYPWMLTGIFATLATLANILDVTALGIPPVAIAAAVKALAPISLVLAFELLMQMVKAEVKRAAIVRSIAELAQGQAEARAESNQLSSELGQLTTKRDQLKKEISGLRKIKRQGHYTNVSNETKTAALAILTERPHITGADLGRELGKSDSLGRKLKRELIPLVSANGY